MVSGLTTPRRRDGVTACRQEEEREELEELIAATVYVLARRGARLGWMGSLRDHTVDQVVDAVADRAGADPTEVGMTTAENTSTGPVLGSQAADNAAWGEIRTAFATATPDRITDADLDDLTGAVTPILARLVDGAVRDARREDGERLRHVDSWDEVSMLIQVWRAGVPPCGAVTRRLGFPQTCLREPGHMLPGHSDGTRGGAW